MRNEKISLVIPAYNEEAILESTIRTALSFLESHFSDYELIISDDGSTDGTKRLAETWRNPRLRVVAHRPNRGKGSAVREGVLAADGGIIVYTDADLAYGIEAVGELVSLLRREGAELAVGSRKLHPEGYEDYPLIRLLASRLFSFLTGLFAAFRYDTQCGLKAFTEKAALEIFTRCETDGFAFDFEAMLLAKGLKLRIVQLPVKIINHRDSKVSVLSDSLRMFGDILRIRNAVKKRLEREASDKKKHGG
ncbi:MAG: glycosyltransferase [Oscillospiraceae bacterium]|jgi:dolichyl-phosphate beta-glucosyltransferase|nr:glycosyltransferase [Oscillospiraceae bacterium]